MNCIYSSTNKKESLKTLNVLYFIMINSQQYEVQTQKVHFVRFNTTKL